MANFQRDGSTSNTAVGAMFEARAQAILDQHGIRLQPNFKVPCGLGSDTKLHSFDLGSEDPPVLVECKSMTWTKGNNVPSAKVHNFAVAMYYFHMAPTLYRKIFFVEESLRQSTGESLLSYFRRTQTHMIPSDVEFWELPRDSDMVKIG